MIINNLKQKENQMRKPYKSSVFTIFMFCLLSIFLLGEKSGICHEWSEIKVRLLPDSSFALVEIEEGQKIRHSPHHDANGKLDAEQLIYVLGTFDDEIWVDQTNRKSARKHLINHYDQFITRVREKGLQPGSVNINQAKLTKLVALPQIGPVLAVKIAEYRNSGTSFTSIEDIKKVEGIGAATFNAIKFYINVD
ncbi:MAG: helix-hairpin-helix domain-containing protein [Pseudomonadota bacterium]|nr:helix-hairpin-helix domain-containing protein [Pseudomonadota bacterium]